MINAFLQIREAESQIAELKEDMDAERLARDRAEKQKRDLAEELEALKLELMDFGHSNESQQEALRKREDELHHFKKTIEEEARAHEAQVRSFPVVLL